MNYNKYPHRRQARRLFGGIITQDQLAARLGTVREVVARSLRELERSGAIRVRRRNIEVVDEKALIGWAQAPFD